MYETIKRKTRALGDGRANRLPDGSVTDGEESTCMQQAEARRFIPMNSAFLEAPLPPGALISKLY